MFGTNEAEPYVGLEDEGRLDVHSIFHTVQGEGPYAGRRATFIRLAGCHLRCKFCDTDFINGRTMMTVADIVTETIKQPNEIVVLTGGEPMRQNIVALTRVLTVSFKKHVQIETAGSFWVPQTHRHVFERMLDETSVSIVVSPKTTYVHPLIEEHALAWKYIIGAEDLISEEDGLPLTCTQNPEKTRTLARPPKRTSRHRIYVQPMDTSDHVRNITAMDRCVELTKKYGYTLSLQQHKIAGVP